MDRERRRRGK